MSRTDLRAILAIAAAAFALRAGTALLTEFNPIFPAYYYADSDFSDHYARETTRAWSRGEKANLSYSPPQRVHILFTALIYRAVGPRPMGPKLANCLAAALGVAAFGLLSGRLFGPRAGTASAFLLALWPSHVFYTSQNFKEGLVCGVLMCTLLLLMPGDDAPRGHRHYEIVAGVALLVLLGLFRSYVMIISAAAIAGAAATALILRNGQRGTAAWALAACLAAPFIFQLSLRSLILGPLAPSVAGPTSESILIPIITDPGSGENHKPLSPRGISEFRRLRQHSDRVYAKGHSGREIGTQLFPQALMKSWLDVLLFIPKSSFHVLFMPLPGLYPLEGKPGRILAAVENLALLAIFVLGLTSAARGGLKPHRLGLLLFFAVMTAGSSLLEFDLGSAGRHKLMYLPMLFPFAAEEALRLAGRRRTA
ncbi:MAG: hypothetical protein NDJ72_07000 [Elusimicrobia bacterium]|nr:hypothetical protein [Elusimicrobiota bacterium]